MKDMAQDHRPEPQSPAAQREAREGVGSLSAQMASSPRQLVQRRHIGEAMGAVVQRAEEPLEEDESGAAQLSAEPVQRQGNRTGMPDDLKTGIESLSGMDMSDVRVHRNSSQPAQLNALAYAQGTDIHLAPGQEHHLPHEAWHVVQQKQGRVQATMQMKEGVPINDDAGLEREADVMGLASLEQGRAPLQNVQRAVDQSARLRGQRALVQAVFAPPAQRKLLYWASGSGSHLSSGDDAVSDGEIQSQTGIQPNVGDLLDTVFQLNTRIVYRVAAVTAQTLTLQKYVNNGPGAAQIVLNVNTPARTSYRLSPAPLLNGARPQFNSALAPTGERTEIQDRVNAWQQQQAVPPGGQAIGAQRGLEQTAYRTDMLQALQTELARSLTVVTAAVDQSFSINNLAIFHLTLSTSRVQGRVTRELSHLTINTDTLKMYLNARAYTVAEFRRNLRLLQAMNAQTFNEQGGVAGNLLSIAGQDNLAAFQAAYPNPAQDLGKQWVDQTWDYAGAEIVRDFNGIVPTALTAGGYAGRNNIHFRIRPADYQNLSGQLPNYEVDTAYAFPAASAELRAALNALIPGLGDRLVVASLAQLTAQQNDPNMPTANFGNFYLVKGDYALYREISELIKATGAASQMLQ